MIPYIIALVGSYLIGESMQGEVFADGGDVSGKDYQIKKPNGTYFYLSMSSGAPSWSTSADMGYQYTKSEAERIKAMLEKEGATGLSIVKYDKDWWKNIPDEFAKGGEVKWQDVETGDSARVKETNKTGVIMKAYGRKFHLKFVDGTEKTYDATELEFFKN